MLKDLIEEKRISAYELSAKSGVPYSTLLDIINGKTNIQNTSAKVLYNLSKTIGISMEELYLDKNISMSLYLYNEGRDVIIKYNDNLIKYQGPKNLVSFKRINAVQNGVIYVDTYYKDGDSINLEEEYIDLNELWLEYVHDTNTPDWSLINYHVGKPGLSKRERLKNESLIVSDNLAFTYHSSTTEDVEIEIINMTRNNDRMLMRLKDYAILSTNMKINMQKRAIETAKRNADIIQFELKRIKSHAKVHN